MNIILLSGGSGKRLWPLSNEVRSKQFIKIFKTDNEEYESMLQCVYHQMKEVVPDVHITIATAKTQVSAIRNQIGNGVEICVEPCRRDTFPAIALVSAYLHDKQGVSEKEVVVVCPVDPYVKTDYFQALKELYELAKQGTHHLTLLGIEPTYPSEKYGYIIPKGIEKISDVISFREKPNVDTAKDYIEKGALWNAGVFAFRLGYLLEKAHELIDFTDYEDLFQKYETLEKISFDYAVVEKEPSIQVMRFLGEWKDLGTWNTLTEAMEESIIGDAMQNEVCENVHIINELDIPILCMGCKDMVISASPDGILVSDKAQSSYIKSYVDKIDQPIRFAEKSWGTYRVLDIEEESLTIKVILKPKEKMNYHNHNQRDEVWVIMEGTGRIILDGVERLVKAGDVITIPVGCCHTIIAETELKVIEVQLGKNISISDKQKVTLENI